MRKQVTHVSVNQSSKVLASLYAFILFLIVIPYAIFLAYHHQWASALLALIFTPLFYWIVLYLAHAIWFFFYNLIAKRLGGIEFDLNDAAARSIGIEEEEPIVSERTINEGKPVNPDRVDSL